MLQYIFALFFFIGAMGLMYGALQFSGYRKRRSSGCCGGLYCDDPDKHSQQNSCCQQGDKNHITETRVGKAEKRGTELVSPQELMERNDK